MSDQHKDLAALALHLRNRRKAILQAWRQAVDRDPQLSTGAALPRAQLNDHLPVILKAYEAQLGPGATEDGDIVPSANELAAAHGLHRWQQGFRLPEVVRELGRLNECVVAELGRYFADHPRVEHDVAATARRLWAEVMTVESTASVTEYFRLQQLEAAGQIDDLQSALNDLRELTQRRADLLHQAAHDIRDNMNVVLTATAALQKTEVAEVPHYNFLRILDRNVMSLRHLLDDMLDLARLQAGKDRRRIAPINVAKVMHDLCEDLQEYARQRDLTLQCSGTTPFLIEGDETKIRRIAQNLVVNALKYTVQGGVTVLWRDSATEDPKRWVLIIEDTGAGLKRGISAAPLTDALEKATDVAAASGSEGTEDTQTVDRSQGSGPLGKARPTGEGIGLSIVKRLAELLDATLEVEAKRSGTTFRVLLPRRYS